MSIERFREIVREAGSNGALKERAVSGRDADERIQELLRSNNELLERARRETLLNRELRGVLGEAARQYIKVADRMQQECLNIFPNTVAGMSECGDFMRALAEHPAGAIVDLGRCYDETREELQQVKEELRLAQRNLRQMQGQRDAARRSTAQMQAKMERCKHYAREAATRRRAAEEQKDCLLEACTTAFAAMDAHEYPEIVAKLSSALFPAGQTADLTSLTRREGT